MRGSRMTTVVDPHGKRLKRRVPQEASAQQTPKRFGLALGSCGGVQPHKRPAAVDVIKQRAALCICGKRFVVTVGEEDRFQPLETRLGEQRGVI
jgi:hypothetical protein